VLLRQRGHFLGAQSSAPNQDTHVNRAIDAHIVSGHINKEINTHAFDLVGIARPSGRTRHQLNAPGISTTTTTKETQMRNGTGVYGRISTDHQNPTSIEDQLRKCAQEAAKENLTINPELVFVDEAITGQAKGTVKRLGLQRLFDAWDAGLVDRVYADELCRLTRDEADGALLLRRVRETGVVLITNDGIDTRRKDWETMWMLKLAFAAAEVRQNSDRTSRTMEGLLERGGMIAAPPFGYRVDWALPERNPGHIGARWAIDPTQAEVVREMYWLRKGGLSVNRIAAMLNERGLPSPRAGRKGQPSFWRGATISRMLGNSVYRGEFLYQGSAYTRAKHRQRRSEPEIKAYSREQFRLVSDALWEACNPPPGERRLRGGVKHVLASFLQCGDCNSILSLKPNKSSMTLVCSGCEQAVKVKARTSYMGYTSAQAALLALRAVLSELMTGPVLAEFRSRLRARLDAPRSDEEARLRAEVHKHTVGQERLLRLAALDHIAQELVEAQLKVTGTELKRSQARLEQIERKNQALSKAEVERQLAVEVDPLLDRLLEGEPTPHEARATLRRLVPKFAFIARPQRGHSVFELSLAPGAYIAERLEGKTLDGELASYRVTVRASAKRPTVWEVDIDRL
jgi:site-specific DNA recombinase